MTDTSLPPPHHHHHLMVPSQNESGYCDNESDLTGMSSHTRKQLHSPYNSTGLGTYSSETSQYLKGLELPPIFQTHFPRSASVENNAQTEPSELLAALRASHRPKLSNTKYPFSSLSQDTYTDYNSRYPFHSPSSMSLSQRTDPLTRSHHLMNDPYYHHYHRHKPGSPASSETSSLASSVVNRLGSHSASEVSFTTTSSSRSNPHRLPRPPRPPSSSQTSSSGSNTSILPHKSMYPAVHEFIPHTRSEVSTGRPSQYDSDHEDSMSTPVLPSMKSKGGTRSERNSLPNGQYQLSRREREKLLREQREVHLRERDAKSGRRQRFEQPRIPEEGSQRDSFTMKLEMVLSVLSIVSSTKDQTDADASKILLALSQSSETCSVMRQSACMNMLIGIMHNLEHKGDMSHHDVRLKAKQTMRNIIESTGETRQGKHELCILSVLEKIRSHCDMLWEFIHSYPGGRRVDPAETESIQAMCDVATTPIRKLYKYSNEKEHYRPAILGLGGLQAAVEVLIVNYRLISSQRGSRASEKPICHSSKTITVVISVLINLTYGDVNNKSTLCNFPDCLKALMFHLRQQNESIIAAGAQVLRNLSWRATADIKESLMKCDASVTLMSAIDHVKDEPTIQYITSALWNLSAHSVENRHKICSTPFGIQQLVELLSYNSPSGTTAVVENVGGILKNLSVVIMQEEEYRRKFRESGGLAKLVQHLKSKNKTVLSNASGILWNLSARCQEDQRHLWDLGCIPLLDVLQTAHQKNIAECARGALRNLLAFGQMNGWTSKSDVMGYNLKTQRGLSKSLSYAANYAFAHGPSQTSKHSNESLHSKRSQPLPKSKSTDSNVAIRSSTERIGDPRGSKRLEDIDGHAYLCQNDEEAYTTQKNKNKLKFSRVGSAPQTNGDWVSYVPSSYVTSSKQPPTMTKPSTVEDSRRRKTSSRTTRPRGRSIPFSLSQSESFHLSSNSELHSVGAAGFELSPHLSNEHGEAPSLSALDPKLDSYDPNHLGARTHEEYADLDIEDDENDDIDNPIHHDDDHLDPFSCADNFARIQTTMRRGQDQPNGSRKSGTSNLALDGTVNSSSHGATDMALGSQESEEARSVRGGSKITTDV